MEALMRNLISLMVLMMSCLAFSYPTKVMKKDQFLVSGKLVLDNALEKSAKGIKTLFIVIYDADSSARMPYAAQKVELGKDVKGQFHSFKLTTNSVQMMGGRMQGLPKNLRIKAKLDKDGSAGPDAPGDIVGVVNKAPIGSKDLTITLKQKI